jgi:hypothetical protein
MKRIVMGVICGLVLGVTGTAVAGVSYSYWSKSFSTYKCEGDSGSVLCNERNSRQKYEVAMTHRSVMVFHQGLLLLTCKRKLRPVDNCMVYGQKFERRPNGDLEMNP